MGWLLVWDLKKGRFIGIEDPQRLAVESFRAALVGQLGFADAELRVDLRALAANAVAGAGGWKQGVAFQASPLSGLIRT